MPMQISHDIIMCVKYVLAVNKYYAEAPEFLLLIAYFWIRKSCNFITAEKRSVNDEWLMYAIKINLWLS